MNPIKHTFTVKRKFRKQRTLGRSITCNLRCSEPRYDLRGGYWTNKKVLQVLLSLLVIKRTTLGSFLVPKARLLTDTSPASLIAESPVTNETGVLVPTKLLSVHFIPFNVRLLSRLPLITQPFPFVSELWSIVRCSYTGREKRHKYS